VAIEIHLQLINLAEEHGFSVDKLPNKPEIYMKVFGVAQAFHPESCEGQPAGV